MGKLDRLSNGCSQHSYPESEGVACIDCANLEIDALRKENQKLWDVVDKVRKDIAYCLDKFNKASPNKPDSRELKFTIPPGTRHSFCKGCHLDIYWIKTERGKNMPCDPDGTPHWATCNKAGDFKPGNKEEGREGKK